MGEAKNNEERVIFAVGATPNGPTVLLGIPEAAWPRLAAGNTQTFDLRKVGLPISIVMFGGKTRGHILDTLGVFNAGGPVFDNQTDFGVPEDEKAVTQMRERARAFLATYDTPTGEIDDEWLDGLCKAILGGDRGETT